MNNNRLSSIKIVLDRTTHPGNIGAAARAMKTMGLQNLCLVSPSHFPDSEATVRAAGADDLLEQANIHSTVFEAIEDCQLVIGTSARLRNLSLPQLDPKACAELLFSKAHCSEKAAIVFGTERTGLENDDLLKCHYHLYVPTVPEFYSLNLASAVQIMAYELRMAFLSRHSEEEGLVAVPPMDPGNELANVGDVERFYEHFQQVLEQLDFLRPPGSKQVISRLKRLFNRAQLETRELNILRGILSSIGNNRVKPA